MTHPDDDVLARFERRFRELDAQVPDADVSRLRSLPPRRRRWLQVPTVALTAAVGVLVTVLFLQTFRPTTPNVGDTPSASAGAAQAAGCEMAVSVPADTRPFIRVEDQLGGVAPAPVFDPTLVVDAGTLPSSMPVPTMSGYELQQVMRSSQPSAGGGTELFVKLLFGGSPAQIGETGPAFIAAGGVIMTARDTQGHDAAYVLSAIAEMDTRQPPPTVQLGPYTAVLVHEDPTIRDDLRPYTLYWSDGTYDYSLEANGDPVALVNLGRSMYCR